MTPASMTRKVDVYPPAAMLDGAGRLKRHHLKRHELYKDGELLIALTLVTLEADGMG